MAKAKRQSTDKHVGQRIVDIRHATEKEVDDFGFDYNPGRPMVVLVLENKELICSSRDPEGNGPGVFFTLSPDGTSTGIG